MQVFSSIVLFGLYHGLAFLPTLLSIIGPPPYIYADTIALSHEVCVRNLSLVQSQFTDSMEEFVVPHRSTSSQAVCMHACGIWISFSSMIFVLCISICISVGGRCFIYIHVHIYIYVCVEIPRETPIFKIW